MKSHDYFTLRRLLLLLITSFSDLCRFQLSYFTLMPHCRALPVECVAVLV